MSVQKTKIVVLTGAGMSAESGISTFRDHDGLWENHRVEDVASIEGWYKNPQLILDFYNQRRKQLFEVSPNKGHHLLASLEQDYDVTIITQNVDDLHERAGSRNIIHLHGELLKVRSEKFENIIYKLDKDRPEIQLGDLCEKGSQLRPYIVWFGEAVPKIEDAIQIVQQADILLIIGTSLQVYPAASLLNYAQKKCPIYFIDPVIPSSVKNTSVYCIEKGASEGMADFLKLLKNK